LHLRVSAPAKQAFLDFKKTKPQIILTVIHKKTADKLSLKIADALGI